MLIGPVVRAALPRAIPGGRGLLPFGDDAGAADEIEVLWYRRVRR
jgi:hypothetical protein